jgi:hypothetical protein
MSSLRQQRTALLLLRSASEASTQMLTCWTSPVIASSLREMSGSRGLQANDWLVDSQFDSKTGSWWKLLDLRSSWRKSVTGPVFGGQMSWPGPLSPSLSASWSPWGKVSASHFHLQMLCLTTGPQQRGLLTTDWNFWNEPKSVFPPLSCFLQVFGHSGEKLTKHTYPLGLSFPNVCL